jgi:hypothetical protein
MNNKLKTEDSYKKLKNKQKRFVFSKVKKRRKEGATGDVNFFIYFFFLEFS